MKGPEGGLFMVGLILCPRSVRFLGHPGPVSFEIRKLAFFDLPELCLTLVIVKAWFPGT